MERANRQMKVIIIVCSKKILGGQWTILGSKMAHPHNSGSAVIIFFKFSTMKRANRQINIGYWQILFKTQEQLGKSQSATSTFKCRGSTAAVLVKITSKLYIFVTLIQYFLSAFRKAMNTSRSRTFQSSLSRKIKSKTNFDQIQVDYQAIQKEREQKAEVAALLIY